MGIRIELQDERGMAKASPINDPVNALAALLPSEDDTSYHLVKYIDRYGNTVFNAIQMKDLMADLERLERLTADVTARTLVRAVRRLAVQCEDEPHLYLKFVGD